MNTLSSDDSTIERRVIKLSYHFISHHATFLVTSTLRMFATRRDDWSMWFSKKGKGTNVSSFVI